MVRLTDRVLEEEVFLNLYNGATGGQGFGRRSFFFNLFPGDPHIACAL